MSRERGGTSWRSGAGSSADAVRDRAAAANAPLAERGHPEQSEPERDLERRAHDPAEREVPFVDGPTGPAPLASELRGDPGDAGDRKGEGGAMAGALGGMAVGGPVGGAVGGVVGAVIGSAAETGSNDEAADQRDAAEEPSGSSVSNADH
jgi:hypothetical protein